MPSRTRGFLFADLRGYTAFVERHGDHAGAALLAAYRTLVRGAIAATEGAEVRTEGDSFYVTFDSASDAVRCGRAIVEAAAAATPPVPVGVGVHAGETVETEEGFVGSAVNIAARVCAKARAGEVLVTDTVRALTRTFLDVGFVPLGPRSLKGLAEPVVLYRVVPAGDATAIRRRVFPRFAWIASALVVVLAGLAIVGGAQLLGRSAASPALPPPAAASASPAASFVTAQSTGAASPAPTATPVPSVTEPTFPDPSEARLLDRLPAPVRNNASCRRAEIDERSQGATASIRCNLTAGLGASVAWFEAFSPATRALETYFERTGRIGLPEGDCSAQPRAWQEWALTGIYAGHLGCFGDAGAAWLVWTYDADGVLARATRPDANSSALFTWWKSVGPFLRS